jgi:LysM repeat protein
MTIVRFSFTVAMVSILLAMFVPAQPLMASGQAGPVGPFTWNAQIFSNPTLAGTPIITRLDQVIGFNWGLGSPGLGIPTDNFSARWTTSATLSAGTYRFTILADDSVRLYVDGTIILNTFGTPRPGETLTAQAALGTGSHSLQLEYRELTSTAYLYLTIEQIAVTPPTPTGPPVGRVNTTGLNVHAGPGYNYSIVVLAFMDWPMTLLGRNRDTTWLQVKTEYGQVGWVEVSHITTSYPVAALPITDGTQPKPPSPAPAPQPGTQARRHVVQPGETLYRIAVRYGVDMYALAQVNGIINLNLIFAGQVLIIP